MIDDDLSADPGALAVGDTPARPADLQKGVKNFMNKLQQLAPPDTTRGGGYMKQFFKEDRLHRRAGERVSDWVTTSWRRTAWTSTPFAAWAVGGS